MRHPIHTIALAIALAACDPGSSGDEDTAAEDTDTGGGGPDSVEEQTGCDLYEPVSETWGVEGKLETPGTTLDVSASSRGAVGQGTLRAEVSFDSFDGALALRAEGASTVEAYPLDVGDTAASLTVLIGNGEGVNLDLYDIYVGDGSAYPIDYSVQYTWTDIVDCFEDNGSEADARYLARDEPHQGMLLGSFNFASGEEGTYSPRDDFYRVTVPEGASGLDVVVSFDTEDIILEAVVYAPGEDPNLEWELLVGSELYPSTDTLVVERPPGEYFLRIREGGINFSSSLYEASTSPAGTAVEQPEEWTVPYTVQITARDDG